MKMQVMRHNSPWIRSIILRVSTHKAIEFQASRWPGTPFFSVNAEYRSKKEDHAGVELEITLVRISFSLSFYDNRHAEDRTQE